MENTAERYCVALEPCREARPGPRRRAGRPRLGDSRRRALPPHPPSRAGLLARARPRSRTGLRGHGESRPRERPRPQEGGGSPGRFGDAAHGGCPVKQPRDPGTGLYVYPRGYQPPTLEEVAAVYRAACETDLAPTKAVSDRLFGGQMSRATRLVHQCRVLDMLPAPPVGGQAKPVTHAENGVLIARFVRDMERRDVRPRSVEKMGGTARSFARFLDDRVLFDATKDDVDGYIDSRRGRQGRRLAPRTKYSILTTLHAFYRWAIDNELTQVDPTVRVRRPKMRRVLPRPIEDRDLTYALEMANPELRAMLLLGCFQGLRCMEIAGLERGDIMDKAKPPKLRVAEGKGGHERVMPLHPLVLEALREHGLPSAARGGPVFRMEHGGSYNPARLSAKLRLVLRRARHRRQRPPVAPLLRDAGLRQEPGHPAHAGADGSPVAQHDGGVRRVGRDRCRRGRFVTRGEGWVAFRPRRWEEARPRDSELPGPCRVMMPICAISFFADDKRKQCQAGR